MINNHRVTMVTVILMSCAYLLIFIPPNLTGAKDPNMLAAFSDELPTYGTDESVQFGILIRMMTLGKTFHETVENTVFYGYYKDGYTFFLTSALTAFPLRLTNKLFPGSVPTTAYMVVLRQLSPLLMLVAILLLVYLWTGFESVVKSVLLFSLLGFIPAIFLNNMFWHPDSLITLFVVLTIFSLAKDNLRFGAWYYLAAVACGLAMGTKAIGLFSILSVAVYLVLGLMQRVLTLRGFLKHGGMFLVVTALTFVISNPLLLMPRVARQYVDTVTEQAKRNAWEWDRQKATNSLAWYTKPGAGGAPSLQEAFGFWWFYLLIVAASLWGMAYNREHRTLNVIVLTWILAILLYLLVLKGCRASPCLIPVFLPMMSCVGNVFRFPFASWFGHGRAPILVCGGILALQFAYYVSIDLNGYTRVLNRERRSPSIRFYRQLSDMYLSQLRRNEGISVVREAKLYLPPSPRWDDEAKWDVFGYDYINDRRPDLIMLSTDTINRQSEPVETSEMYPDDREQWLRSHRFYHDAKMGSVAGFCKLLETGFGVAFVRKPECLTVIPHIVPTP